MTFSEGFLVSIIFIRASIHTRFLGIVFLLSGQGMNLLWKYVLISFVTAAVCAV
ncbi:hypothetical protein ACEQPO_00990 [Bacillus sp. SL00103]